LQKKARRGLFWELFGGVELAKRFMI